MQLQYSIIAAASLLALATALPQLAEETTKCPKAPCQDYIDILEYCSDKKYEVYDLEWEYKTEDAIDCVCSKEALGKAADWSGWNATSVCYNCGDYEEETEDYDLMYNWLNTCKTWAWIDEEAARECWNSKLKKGCWEPQEEEEDPYKMKSKKNKKVRMA
ncbi:hypothetical protein PV05_06275 [Exophiala xenobiotica]|uniref:Uncharacterized protein n=1 Tax=Exophiala xenobiotica TaxID=348802 RepID=A0A0D2F1L6_9EURO|nr:uncharacterized protein PV05_06275 [Exophiala xenobiotica]KIW53864.1 hypothetical protein PV05_06275 [Exophiala xenobiotica]